jgi:hypothetical protein
VDALIERPGVVLLHDGRHDSVREHATAIVEVSATENPGALAERVTELLELA